MKKVLLAALAAAGVYAYRQWKQTEQTRKVWDDASDTVDN